MTVANARRVLAALAATALLGTTVLATGPGAQAATNGDWSAYPKRATDSPQFTPRQYFFFDVTPGAVVKDTLTLKNAKRVPLILDIYPSDAYNVRAGGGFAINALDEDPKDVGSWIKLPVDRVTVPAAQFKTDKKTKKRELVEGTRNVPFTMSVPRGATPGDHAGGIVTIEPSPSSSISGGTGATIGVRRSLTVRVYTRVKGPLNPQLLVTDVHYTNLKPAVMPFLGSQGTASIEYTYSNTGNVRITPLTEISFKGLFGRTLHTTGSRPGIEILPGQTITLSETVNGMPVLDRVTARVAMKGNGEADRSVEGVSTAGDDVRWSISWVFVAVMILVIAGIVVWRFLKRRQTMPDDETPAGRRRASAVASP